MFEELKTLFSRAWESFRTELHREEPEDQVAALLSAMRREMVEARAALPGLDELAARAKAELERERRALDDCLRRQAMAERIGDVETVRVAGEFARKHRERVEVLEGKLRAAEAERELRRREVEEMSRKYKEAEANRFALLARVSAARAGGRIRSVVDGELDELARFEEEIDRGAAYADALEEMGERPPEREAPVDVEERLRELKRRMERE